MKTFNRMAVFGLAAAIAVFGGRALAQEDDLDDLLSPLECVDSCEAVEPVGKTTKGEVGVDKHRTVVEEMAFVVEAEPAVEVNAEDEVEVNSVADQKVIIEGKPKNRTDGKFNKQGQKTSVKSKPDRRVSDGKAKQKKLPSKSKGGKSAVPASSRSAQK